MKPRLWRGTPLYDPSKHPNLGIFTLFIPLNERDPSRSDAGGVTVVSNLECTVFDALVVRTGRLLRLVTLI